MPVEVLTMRLVSVVTLAVFFLLSSCAHMSKVPVPTVAHVDLPRFMGDWYVIASIPTFLEKRAYNAVESYRLDPDGTIATTFTFRKGSFRAPLKTMRPRAWVRDSSNAIWGMQFLWPIKAEYLIAYVDDDYTQTIIARSARRSIFWRPTITSAWSRGSKDWDMTPPSCGLYRNIGHELQNWACSRRATTDAGPRSRL